MSERLLFIFLFFLFLSSTLFGLSTSEDKNKADQYFNNGIKLFDSADYTIAIESFKKSLSFMPEKDESYYYIGQSYLKLNKYKKAEDAIRSAIKINPENDDYYIELIYLYKHQKEYKNALFYAKRALNYTKDPLRFKLLCGEIYTAKKDYQSALGTYYALKSKNINKEVILVRILDIYKATNNLKMQRAIALEILKIDPGNLDAKNIIKALKNSNKDSLKSRLQQSKEHQNIKNGTPAKDGYGILPYIILLLSILLLFLLLFNRNRLFVYILNRYPDQRIIDIWIGTYSFSEASLHEIESNYIKNRNYKDLVYIFYYLAGLIEINLSFLERYAYYCELAGDYSKAEKVYIHMIKIEKNQFTKLRIANNFIKLKKYSSAYKYYDDFLTECPDRLEDVIFFLNEEIKIYPRKHEIKELLADIHLRANKYSSALVIYDSLIPFYKGTRILEKASKCLNKLSDWKKLQVYSKDLINLNPRVSEYYFMLAEAYFHLGRVNSCIEQMDILIKRFPVIIDDILIKNSEFSRELNYFENSIPLLKKAAYLLQSSNRFSEAINICKDVLELSPDDVEILILKAEILTSSGDFEEAIDILEVIEGYNNRALDLLLSIFNKTHSKKVLLLICTRLVSDGESIEAIRLYKKYYINIEKDDDYFINMSNWWKKSNNLKKSFFYKYLYTKNSKKPFLDPSFERNLERSNNIFTQYMTVKIGISLKKPRIIYSALISLILQCPRKEKIISLFYDIVPILKDFDKKFVDDLLKHAESTRLNPILQACTAIYYMDKNKIKSLEHIERAYQVFPTSIFMIKLKAEILLLSGNLEDALGVFFLKSKHNKLIIDSLMRTFFTKKIDECNAYLEKKDISFLELPVVNFGKIKLNVSNCYKKGLIKAQNSELLLCYSYYKLGKYDDVIKFVNSRIKIPINKTEMFIDIIYIKSLKAKNIIDLADKKIKELKNDIIENAPWLKKYLS